MTFDELPSNEILHGDARDILEQFPDESVPLTITSPPYNIDKDYGDGYDDRRPIDEWKEMMEDVMEELFRITPPDGKVAINVGVSFGDVDTHCRYYRIPLNHYIIDIGTDVGFDLFDEYAWVKPQFASHGGGALFGSYPDPTNMMANQMHEYIIVFRKWVSEDYYQQRELPAPGSEVREESKVTREQWQTFTQSCWEIPPVDPESLGLTPSEAVEEPERVLQNLIGAYAEAVDADTAEQVAEFFDEDILGNTPEEVVAHRPESVWQIDPAKPSELGINHDAIFPVEIPERLIRLYSFVGDTVLDPFMGTGTTAQAAQKTDRDYLGIELNEEFIETAKVRLNGRLEETAMERKRARRAQQSAEKSGQKQMTLGDGLNEKQSGENEETSTDPDRNRATELGDF